ncbi:MAG: metal-dependent hydrolase [Thermodesulfobacteriota bacterium]
MGNTLTWHGHSCFEVRTPDAAALIDPFLDGNPKSPDGAKAIQRCDLVLVTHDHGDHVGQAVDICKRTGAMLGAIVGTAGKLQQAGVPQAQVIGGIGFNIGGTVEAKGIRATMTQAYHSSDSGAPVGYILTLPDGFTLYHAGDTGIFAGMETWGRLHSIDLALLPIGGFYTMDARQAALACALLGCKAVTPMHWGTFPVLEADTQTFAAELAKAAPNTRLQVMEPGKPVELKR